MKRADICALCMALCKRSGPHEFVTHNRGVVQPLNEDEEDWTYERRSGPTWATGLRLESI